MINANKASVIQAVPLLEGKVNLGAGTYNIQNIIHCETDTEVTLHFVTGDQSYVMESGADRAYNGSLTVVSGTVTID